MPFAIDSDAPKMAARKAARSPRGGARDGLDHAIKRHDPALAVVVGPADERQRT